MKKEIIKIKEQAAIIFNNQQYARFCRFIESNQINDARLLVDEEIRRLTNQIAVYQNNGIEIAAACTLIDLIIDLIVNEMDNDREKQIKSTIRKRRRRKGGRFDTLV